MGWGWAKNEVGAGLGNGPHGVGGGELSCFEPFSFLLSQLRLGQSPSPPKPERKHPSQPQFLCLERGTRA